jgi:hypothetical protein
MACQGKNEQHPVRLINLRKGSFIFNGGCRCTNCQSYRVFMNHVSEDLIVKIIDPFEHFGLITNVIRVQMERHETFDAQAH